MTHVAIELPEEIASRLGEPGNLSRVALEALAAHGYRNGKLTHAEVQKMLGLTSRWETDSFLKQAGAYLCYMLANCHTPASSGHHSQQAAGNSPLRDKNSGQTIGMQ